MPPVARFGSNLRKLRKESGLLQKQFGDFIELDEPGKTAAQNYVAKLEQMEYAPRPDTVDRIAEGVAKATRLPKQQVIARLLAGVPARYDLIHQTRLESERAWVMRMEQLIAGLSPEHRQAFMDALEAHARAWKAPRTRKADT